MKKTGVRKIAGMILSAVYTVIAVLLQCSVFPRLRLLGAIPEITLCVTVCVACFEDARFSCVLAVCAGFLLDTVGSDRYTLSPFLFLLAAAFTILLRERINFNKALPCAIAGLTALTAGAVKTTLILAFNGAPVGAVIAKTVLPQLLYGVIVFIPVFLLAALHNRIFQGKADQEYRFAQ